MKKDYKKKGIRGRSSDEDVKNRRRIELKLREKHPNIPRDQFIHMLKGELDKNSIAMPASNTTLCNDFNELQLFFTKSRSKQRNNHKKIQESGMLLSNCISQITISSSDKELLLYKKANNNNSRHSLKSFKKKYEELNNTLKEKQNKLKEYKQIIEANKEKNIPSNQETIKEKAELRNHIFSLIHFYIILNDSGYEHYIAKLLSDECDKILFTCEHNRCAEIVCNLRYLNTVAEYIYYLIESIY